MFLPLMFAFSLFQIKFLQALHYLYKFKLQILMNKPVLWKFFQWGILIFYQWNYLQKEK